MSVNKIERIPFNGWCRNGHMISGYQNKCNRCFDAYDVVCSKCGAPMIENFGARVGKSYLTCTANRKHKGVSIVWHNEVDRNNAI